MIKNRNRKIVNENIQEIVRKQVEDKSIVFRAIFHKCKEDKKYFISLLITLFTLGFIFIVKVRDAEGVIIKKDSKPVVVVDAKTVTNEDDNKENKNYDKDSLNEKISLEEYIGYYSENIKLKEPLKVNDECSIVSYKNVYHITKDNKVIKYYYNECIGTIKLWDGNFSYVIDDGTRYISSNGYYFKFGKYGLKEIKNDERVVYKEDSELHNLRENLIVKGVNLYFFGDSLIFLKSDDLIQLKKDEIIYQASKKYLNNGGNIEQRFYKSANKYQFKFIVFKNGEDVSCYKDISNDLDGSMYEIYNVRYNVDSGLLEDEMILERLKSAGCEQYENDIEILKE